MPWGNGFDKPWSNLYLRVPEINWNNPYTEGLIGAFLPGHGYNLVRGQAVPDVLPQPINQEGLFAWSTDAAQVDLYTDVIDFQTLARGTGVTGVFLRWIPI